MTGPVAMGRPPGKWRRISHLRWGVVLLSIGIVTILLAIPSFTPRTAYEGTMYEDPPVTVLGPLDLERGSYGLYIEDVNSRFDDMQFLWFEVMNDAGVDAGIVEWEPADYRVKEVEGVSCELMMGLDVDDEGLYTITFHETGQAAINESSRVYEGARWFLVERPTATVSVAFFLACVCISFGCVLVMIHLVKGYYTRGERASPSLPPGPHG